MFDVDNIADIKNLTQAIQAGITACAIFIGSVWAFWKFIIQRGSKANIEFDLDINWLGVHKEKLLAEIIAIVINKGQARQRLYDFKFDLHHLTESDDIVEGDDRINQQVLFKKLIKNRYWIPPTWLTTFIDPNVTQKYRYVCHIPVNSKFVLLYAQFKYPGILWRSTHTAQKVFVIDQSKIPENMYNKANAADAKSRAAD